MANIGYQIVVTKIHISKDCTTCFIILYCCSDRELWNMLYLDVTCLSFLSTAIKIWKSVATLVCNKYNFPLSTQSICIHVSQNIWMNDFSILWKLWMFVAYIHTLHTFINIKKGQALIPDLKKTPTLLSGFGRHDSPHLHSTPYMHITLYFFV